MAGNDTPRADSKRGASTAEGTGAVPSAASSRIPRLRRFVWPPVCLFQFGLILGGVHYVARSGSSVETEQAAGDMREAPHVVDRAPGHELTPLAYLRVGRLYQEERNTNDAVRPLNWAAACQHPSPRSPSFPADELVSSERRRRGNELFCPKC